MGGRAVSLENVLCLLLLAPDTTPNRHVYTCFCTQMSRCGGVRKKKQKGGSAERKKKIHTHLELPVTLDATRSRSASCISTYVARALVRRGETPQNPL